MGMTRLLFAGPLRPTSRAGERKAWRAEQEQASAGGKPDDWSGHINQEKTVPAQIVRMQYT